MDRVLYIGALVPPGTPGEERTGSPAMGHYRRGSRVAGCERPSQGVVGSLSAGCAGAYRESMPADNGSPGSRLHELCVRAQAARRRSLLLARQVREIKDNTAETLQLTQA